MGKIFKIAGNFNQNQCSFSARVVVENDNTFCGYCKHIIMNSYYSVDRYFVTGVIAEDGEHKGLAFYLLSNDPKDRPLMFVVPNIDEAGECGSFEEFGTLKIRDKSSWGEANATYNELSRSNEDETYIKVVCFGDASKLDRNKKFIDSTSYCAHLLEKAQSERRRLKGD